MVEKWILGLKAFCLLVGNWILGKIVSIGSVMLLEQEVLLLLLEKEGVCGEKQGFLYSGRLVEPPYKRL